MPNSLTFGNGFSVEVPDNPTVDQIKQSEAKAERNSELAKTDVYMVADFPISKEQKSAWQTYRQALRDMDFSNPDNITWPTKPE